MELVLVALGGIASAGLIAALRFALQPLEKPPPAARPSLPAPAILVAAVGVLAAPGLGWALSPSLVEYAVSTAPADLAIASPNDTWVARLCVMGLLTVWAALPGLSGLLHMALSSRRSLARSGLFAAAITVGFSFGALIALKLVPSALSMMTTALDGLSGITLELRLLDVVGVAVRLPVVLGLTSAGVAGLWVLVSTSERGARLAIWATAAAPLLIALLAAIGTPPDVASQVLLALALTVCWMLGLGGGFALRALVSRASAGAKAD